jgi:hypothetical protein
MEALAYIGSGTSGKRGASIWAIIGRRTVVKNITFSSRNFFNSYFKSSDLANIPLICMNTDYKRSTIKTAKKNGKAVLDMTLRDVARS